MSKLSTSQLKKLPDSCFCGPNRTIPVMDQMDMDQAMKDHPELKSKIMARGKSLKLKLPAMMSIDREEDDTVFFFESDPFEETNSYLTIDNEQYPLRIGRLFRLGDYPDKKFALNPEEADLAISNYKPVHFNYEHVDGFLNGQMGQVTDIWREDEWIWGAAAVHPWIDKKWAVFGRKVSGEWTRDTKLFSGCAMTLDPRVDGASLQTEFSNRKEGKKTMKLTWKVFFQRLGIGIPEGVDGDEEVSMADVNETNPIPNPTAEFSALQQQIKDLQQSLTDRDSRIARVEMESRNKIAFSNVETLKLEEHILPAVNANDDLLTFFNQLIEIDQSRNTKVTFNKVQTGGLMDLAMVLFGRLPKHGLTEELIPNDVLRLDANSPDEQDTKKIREQAIAFAKSNNRNGNHN